MSPHSAELYPQGRILALDLATRTGWAVWSGAARTSGVHSFAIGDREPRGWLYHKFDTWLVEMLNPEPALIVYEEPGHLRSREAGYVLYGFLTRVWEAADIRHIPRRRVAVSTLKKWATGSGKATKAEMVAAVLDRYPKALAASEEAFLRIDDNEADAIALLEYARATLLSEEAA